MKGGKGFFNEIFVTLLLLMKTNLLYYNKLNVLKL